MVGTTVETQNTTTLQHLYYINDISLKATVYWFFSKIVKFCSCRLCFFLTCFNGIFTKALGGAFTCVTSTLHYSLAYALERPTTQVSVLDKTKKIAYLYLFIYWAKHFKIALELNITTIYHVISGFQHIHINSTQFSW